MKNIKLHDYHIILNVPDELLKSNISTPENFKALQKQLICQVEDTLLQEIKQEYPSYPDNVILAFIKQYIDLEVRTSFGLKRIFS